MQLSSISLAITRLVGGLSAPPVFTPASLFTTGTNGCWHDPGDYSTLFQDSAGTTPVTAVEQPVGLILDKSKGLVLGTELVTNGDFQQGTTGWAYTIAGTSTASISGGQATLTRGNSYCFITQNGVLTAGKVYSVTLDVVSTTGTGAIVNNSGVSYASFTTSGTKTFKFRHSSGATSVLYLEAQSGTVVFDNISVRELPGNHAFQSTSANRPTLSARYNLLTKTEDISAADWTKTGTTPASASLLLETATTSSHSCTLSPTTAAATYIYSVKLKANGRTRFAIAATSNFGGNLGNGVFFDLSTGSYVSGANGTPSITPLADGWYQVSYTWTAFANYGVIGIFLVDSGTNTSYAGDVTKGMFIKEVDLRPANQSSLPYQRVNTATDYDSDATKFPWYLKFNGTSSSMQTASINFTATDKMFVSAGVRKLSDATSGAIAELSTGGSVGSFLLNAPSTTGNSDYQAVLYGNDIGIQRATPFAAPITNVVSASYNFAGATVADEISIRINGATPTLASSGTPSTTAAFGNYPLYIGARAGTSLFFNGDLYQLVIAGKQASTEEITSTETYINSKTKAY